MNKYLLLFFGFGATFFKSISFIPQASKIIESNDTSGLSLHMYVCLIIMMIFWIIYAINKSVIDYPILIANIIALIFVLFITYKIIKNRHNVKST